MAFLNPLFLKLKKPRLATLKPSIYCTEREGIFMKMVRIVFIVLMAWTFLIGQATAAQDDNFSDSSTAIKTEHRFLANQLIQQTGGKVRIKIHSKTGNVNYIGVDPANAIRQPSSLGAKPTPEEAARGFLAVYGPLFGLREQARELRIMRTKTSEQGRSSVRFQQVHSGVPIFGGESIVQVDSSKNIISAHSKILSDIDIDTTPAISAEVAEKAAQEILIKTYQNKYTFDVSALQVSKPELWIYNPFLLGRGKDVTCLVWRMEVTPKEMLPIRELVLVDAMFGNVVLHFNQIDAALNRSIYDSNNSSSFPGNLMRSEGGPPSSITDVNKAYDYAGDTYNFYWNYHGRNSINNAGMNLISTTRYCPGYPYPCPYPNAFWDGTQMVYGQGFASADDVVAHEMTHGVTDYESNLIYLGQSGAINEAFSDIWGEFVDLTNGKGNDTATVRWLMGEDLSIHAIRSMKNPPTYGDPDRIWSTNFYCGECDNGGVHWNSGVGNKAAYLMTDGGTFNGITGTGLGIAKVAKIFYEAQTNLLISSSDYEDLANALYQACWDFVGTDDITTLDCNQVANAINATEMNHHAPENLDQNPGFESGRDGSWTENSSGGYAIITYDPYSSVCGDYFAWLGGYNYAVDYIYQDIAIPSNATQASIQFVYGIGTAEGGGIYDRMFVEVRRPSDNFLLKTLLTLSNANAGIGDKVPYDLSATRVRQSGSGFMSQPIIHCRPIFSLMIWS
jgi:Zn-dependent metalloprotease